MILIDWVTKAYLYCSRAILLEHVVYRMGLLAVIRSRVKNGKVTVAIIYLGLYYVNQKLLCQNCSQMEATYAQAAVQDLHPQVRQLTW